MTGILDGIRVFDMTLAAVGPWASKLLGQLGADVIKVESPEPEMAHQIPPRIKGTGVLYVSANFNKRQIVLDLKDDDDREKGVPAGPHCATCSSRTCGPARPRSSASGTTTSWRCAPTSST